MYKISIKHMAAGRKTPCSTVCVVPRDNYRATTCQVLIIRPVAHGLFFEERLQQEG
jgi:hypothetical protein